MLTDRARDILLFVAGLVGLGVSALLLAEYIQPAPALCGEGGGCGAVRDSDYAALFGIPTPWFGIAFFGLMCALSSVSGSRTEPIRRWHAIAGALGAAGGIGFIAIQLFVVEAVCTWCMIADVSAIVAFALAWSLRDAPLGSRLAPIRVGVAVSVAIAGFSMSYFSGEDEMVAVGGVPEFVTEAQKPGVVTIVEYVDFECPVCRKLGGQMADVLPDYEGKVRVVYRHLPLEIHRHAVHAARGVVCAEEVGRDKELAEVLFQTDKPTASKVARKAEELGLDMEAFRSCIGSERVEERLARDRADAQRVGIGGVPTFWIGRQQFTGAIGKGKIRRAIEQALK